MGYKAFHLACINNQLKIVEILVENSIKIDLTTKTWDGKTGFQLAQKQGKFNIVTMLKLKVPSIE